MNPAVEEYGYICFYKSKRTEVYARNMYEAKEKAIKAMNVPHHKRFDVIVVLAEVLGKDVVQNALF